jgi:hypothetical protein
METVLETELATYAAHRDELLREAEGKWVLIHGHDVLDIFEDQNEAIDEGYRRLGNVAFLAKQILHVEVIETVTSVWLSK